MEIATGIIMAMMDIGPRPGNIPMKVPIRQPPMTINKFWIEKAVCRPSSNPSSMSDSKKIRQWAHVYAQNLLNEIPNDKGSDNCDWNHDMPFSIAKDY